MFLFVLGIFQYSMQLHHEWSCIVISEPPFAVKEQLLVPSVGHPTSGSSSQPSYPQSRSFGHYPKPLWRWNRWNVVDTADATPTAPVHLPLHRTQSSFFRVKLGLWYDKTKQWGCTWPADVFLMFQFTVFTFLSLDYCLSPWSGVRFVAAEAQIYEPDRGSLHIQYWCFFSYFISAFLKDTNKIYVKKNSLYLVIIKKGLLIIF